MKAVLGWLGDPYIHVTLLGIVLVYCAMGFQAEESIEAATKPISCRVCLGSGLSHSHDRAVVASVNENWRTR